MSCLCFIALTAEDFGALAARPKRRIEVPRVIAETAVDTDGAPIVVEVLMGGKKYRLLVDTGAGRSGFDVAHRAALGRPSGTTEVQTSAGSLVVEKFQPPLLELGRIRFQPRDEILCASIPITDASGRRVDGLLGMDVLGGLVLAFDFDGGSLRFLSAADGRFGRSVRLFRHPTGDPHCRLVRAYINGGKREDFLIDTGCVNMYAGGIA
ncbi:MAG: retropepsin-like aspartic protease, partial [Pirellulales bacterium]